MMAYIPLDLDAFRTAGLIDGGLGQPRGFTISGLLDLWCYVRQTKDPIVTPLRLSGHFAPDLPHLAESLIAFGFLEAVGDGSYRALNVPPVRAWQERQTASLDPVIYFVQVDGAGPIKIGFTENLEKRIQGMLTATPGTIKVLATRPGTLAEERVLHQRFAHLRVSREWFRPEEDLITYIRGLG